MTEVVGVKFKSASKIYFFDGDGIELELGDPVIVETARGLEYGQVASFPTHIEKRDEKRQLKKVLRKADDNDTRRQKENKIRSEEAIEICEEKIRDHGLDMKLVDVEYTFDRSKIIFYFTSGGRVDFRELVKDLAQVFRTRIELRQIGVRDEAKMMGGVGCCGRELCCHEWMPDFQPVSIKMAKTQNLSLNPTKISGICGRLMCCLKFENDVYNELGKGMPAAGERVQTPDGEALVVDVNILVDKIKCRLLESDTDEEGNPVEKLGPEILTYGKEDIQRLRNRRGKGGGHHSQAPRGKEESKEKEQAAGQETAEPAEASGNKEGSSGKKERSGRRRRSRRGGAKKGGEAPKEQ